MKLAKYLSALLVMLVLLSANVIAQEEEMTEEEWQAEITRLTEVKTARLAEKAELEGAIASAKAELAALQAVEDCYKETYRMLGNATEADVDNFRARVKALEAKINRKEEPKEDRQAELDALKANAISALPEFYNKVHNELQRKLDAWIIVPKEVNYTVVKGDCLWNIAKKDEHYANGFAWPMIYRANKDKIKNADLIYPAQEFTIPNLSDEEKAKYDKIRRNYKPAPTE